MFHYFSKEARNFRRAKKQVLKHISVIKGSVIELENMEKWPRERLMDARDRQYEILAKLANLEVQWESIIGDSGAQDLRSYLNEGKRLASYLNDEMSWCNPTTDQVRKYPYPKDDVEVLDNQTGYTKLGWYARVSADYFVRMSLKTWSKMFNEQVLARV